jgi:hypothetical protein
LTGFTFGIIAGSCLTIIFLIFLIKINWLNRSYLKIYNENNYL